MFRADKLFSQATLKVNYHPTYDIFNPGELRKEEARKKLELAEENILLFFGFVREYKGLRFLLKAMPEILKKIEARLVIAGEFWESKDIYLEMVDELNIGNQVTVVDRYIPNEEVASFFYAADIVVLPYTSVTGSGLVQLAYGFNKPVVVSGIGALAEVVRDRETGFIVSPKNPEAIAKAVTSFFTESNREAMTASIKGDKGKFAWEHLVKIAPDFKGPGGQSIQQMIENLKMRQEVK